jgi:hypothetical protein
MFLKNLVLCSAVSSLLESRLNAGAQDICTIIIYDDKANIACEAQDIDKVHTNILDYLTYTGDGTSFDAGLKCAAEVDIYFQVMSVVRAVSIDQILSNSICQIHDMNVRIHRNLLEITHANVNCWSQ